MQLALVSDAGAVLSRATFPITRQHRWEGQSKICFSESRGAFEVVVDSFGDSDLFNDDIIDEMPRALVNRNPLGIQFNAGDDRTTKKFYRICATAAGANLARAGVDDSETFETRWRKEHVYAMNILLGTMIARSIGMEIESVKTLIKKYHTYNEPFLENDLEAICCSAPTCEITVKYRDLIMGEDAEDALDVALFSAMSIDTDADDDDDSGRPRVPVVFFPQKYEIRKESLESYLKTGLDLLIRKYIVVEGISFCETTLRTAIIDLIVEKFSTWIAQRSNDNLYKLTSVV